MAEASVWSALDFITIDYKCKPDKHKPSLLQIRLNLGFCCGQKDTQAGAFYLQLCYFSL
jgi:hypothetical protein